jgi:ribosomal protein S18 acetylase RimI-like enzyme
LPFEIARVQPGAIEDFYRANEREALKTFYDFTVVWDERTYAFAALEDERTVAALTLRIAASLGHVDRVVVDPQHRCTGIGRALLAEAADTANYYNCHKMTVMVPHNSAAQQFFEACGYRVEAVLPQHTFKLDMAVMRKFLL